MDSVSMLRGVQDISALGQEILQLDLVLEPYVAVIGVRVETTFDCVVVEVV